MGQYFIPVIVDHTGRPIRAVAPTDYGSEQKLSTHTPLMTAVETLLLLDGGARLVWAGDDDNPDDGQPALYWLLEPHHFVRFAGLIDDHEPVTANAEPPVTITAISHRYICNPDKQQYIDKDRLGIDDHGIRRSPLPWLTAEGGPTTRGRHISWARDRIYLRPTHPGADWTEIPNLLWI